MSKLLTKTLQLLDETDKSAPEICVGAGVTLGWLQSLRYGIGKRGKLRDPSVDRVERLYEYLSGKTLKV